MEKYYGETASGACCPAFIPEALNEKEIVFKDEPFVKDRVFSFMHIPLNFGPVMVRNWKIIEKENASPENWLILSDENSFWGSDMYIKVTKEVPGLNNTKITGKFLTKVYEGSYKNMKNWISDMENYVKGKGKELEKMYFFYTTCPKCAKIYNKNYVVLFAQIK